MSGNRCAPGVKKSAQGSCLPVKPAPGCKTDLCTAKKSGRRDLLDRLRPEKPASWAKNPKTWLDTNNIDAVMLQYERAYPHFKYLSTLPIDAFEKTKDGACVSRFCGLSLASLKAEGKTIVGMVMNLDRHDQSGSHWVMAALDLRKKSRPAVYYYDSFGKPPPKLMKAQFVRFLAQLRGGAKEHALAHSFYNTRAHQRGNSECGLHSLVSLEHVLKGGDFVEYCQSDVSDADAFAARDRLFSGPPPKPQKAGFFARLFQ
jgi:hypothetical protein